MKINKIEVCEKLFGDEDKGEAATCVKTALAFQRGEENLSV
jgi:hypothetical protein